MQARPARAGKHSIFGLFFDGPTRGFTSIELIIVMVCLSILVISVGFKFNSSSMVSVASADQLASDLRYIRAKAINIGQPYKLILMGNSYTLSRTDGVEIETKTLPNNESASSASCGSLTFNTLGEPDILNDCSISFSGDSKLILMVYSITGNVEVLRL